VPIKNNSVAPVIAKQKIESKVEPKVIIKPKVKVELINQT
jgi:hypothetical protein